MKIVLLVVGKTDSKLMAQATEEYIRRLSHYVSFEMEVIPDVRLGSKLSAEQQKDAEGREILARFRPSDSIVLLDERGREYSSMEFSALLQKKMLAGTRRMVFVIGGPYGFSPTVQEAVTDRISLSRMTFSHQMIRLFFTEQVYRAMTILNHEPYHHE
ncbi:50S rRNA methyltransferase [Porphyromonas gulae]|uniref:23S rRNA (pseudouridine(1915)-N(3))-methyltransferase RlmH n=1 Tax=Porphyromonas gulae TaxID=111105 RepID=UPI0003792F43|nr:23S rRNA (pseudouridine(1915)-N(3))-methyltransferase RlmH [Porphyromonas gulae]KGL47261.1 50S rRNA methyltransferase [Porphyromonas gulae]KGN77755.1 50S rRNA methyltransferase [Porphyromonas gulae]KGN92384.1 50S rRNA methyltransferase [Porphyromonas gulae]KGO02829.1 50S rRNA methyltransferase [Porphyromonas gulae]KKC51329.1 50S rRNA methyltransferase [Porphyromonas gulae]